MFFSSSPWPSPSRDNSKHIVDWSLKHTVHARWVCVTLLRNAAVYMVGYNVLYAVLPTTASQQHCTYSTVRSVQPIDDQKSSRNYYTVQNVQNVYAHTPVKKTNLDQETGKHLLSANPRLFTSFGWLMRVHHQKGRHRLQLQVFTLVRS